MNSYRIRRWLRAYWRFRCRIGGHHWGYVRDRDACMCFRCGALAPLRVWRELLHRSQSCNG
jgi:hypothetical protein